MVLICLLMFIVHSGSKFFFLILYFPKRNAFSHVVVPFILGEVALHVLTETLSNLRHGDEVLGNTTVVLASPDVVLIIIKGEVSEPAAGLEQRDGFDLRVINHPEEHLAIIAGRVEPATVTFHFRYLRQVAHEFVRLAISVY